MGGRIKDAKVWRRRVIKHYQRRAEKFIDRAKTPEEKMAWMEVSKWFDDILDKSKFNSKRKTIGIPQIEIDKLNQELDNELFGRVTEW